MAIRDRFRELRGVLRLVTPALVLLGVVLASGCVEARDRSTLTDPGSGDGEGSGSSARGSLSVELIAPDGSQDFFVMGREMEIEVRGSQGSGRLQGLGYEVRRSGFLRIIHQDQEAFPATGSARETFTYVPPDTLPSPTLLLIRGYALGDRQEREYSDFTEVQVLFCPDDAVWC